MIHILEQFLQEQVSFEDSKEILKSLFKPAGQLRDYQVQYTLLDEIEDEINDIFPHYRNWLLAKITNSQIIFQQSLSSFKTSRLKNIKNEMGISLQLLDEQSFTNKYRDGCLILISHIEQKSSNKLHDRQWHQIRRDVKTLLFNLTVLTLDKSMNNFKKNDLHKLKYAGDILGIWHDWIMCSNHFATYSKESGTQNNKNAQRVIEIASSKANSHLKKIEIILPEILKNLKTLIINSRCSE